MGLEGGLSIVKDSASLDGIKVLILKGSNFEFVSLSKKKKKLRNCALAIIGLPRELL